MLEFKYLSVNFDIPGYVTDNIKNVIINIPSTSTHSGFPSQIDNPIYLNYSHFQQLMDQVENDVYNDAYYQRLVKIAKGEPITGYSPQSYQLIWFSREKGCMGGYS